MSLLRAGPYSRVRSSRWTRANGKPAVSPLAGALQNVRTRSALAINLATSGGVDHVPPNSARSSSVAPRATAQPFQTWIGTPFALAVASKSRNGGTPTPSSAARTSALTISDASPASTMRAVWPTSIDPLIMRCHGIDAFVASADPLVEM